MYFGGLFCLCLKFLLKLPVRCILLASIALLFFQVDAQPIQSPLDVPTYPVNELIENEHGMSRSGWSSLDEQAISCNGTKNGELCSIETGGGHILMRPDHIVSSGDAAASKEDIYSSTNATEGQQRLDETKMKLHRKNGVGSGKSKFQTPDKELVKDNDDNFGIKTRAARDLLRADLSRIVEDIEPSLTLTEHIQHEPEKTSHSNSHNSGNLSILHQIQNVNDRKESGKYQTTTGANQIQPENPSSANDLSNHEMMMLLEGLAVFANDLLDNSIFSSGEGDILRNDSIQIEVNKGEETVENKMFNHTYFATNKTLDVSKQNTLPDAEIEEVANDNNKSSVHNLSENIDLKAAFHTDKFLTPSNEEVLTERKPVFITLEDYRRLKKNEDSGMSHQAFDKYNESLREFVGTHESEQETFIHDIHSKTHEKDLKHQQESGIEYGNVHGNSYNNQRKINNEKHITEYKTNNTEDSISSGIIGNRSENHYTSEALESLTPYPEVNQTQEQDESFRAHEENYGEHGKSYGGELHLIHNGENYSEQKGNYRGRKESYIGKEESYRGIEESYSGKEKSYSKQEESYEEQEESYEEREQRLLREQQIQLNALIETQRQIEQEHQEKNEAFLRQQELLILKKV